MTTFIFQIYALCVCLLCVIWVMQRQKNNVQMSDKDGEKVLFLDEW